MNTSNQHENDDRMVVLRTMRALESSVYNRPRAQNMPEIFRGLWRRQIVEWMYVLIKYCKLKHEATAAAVYYLDAAVMCESSLVISPRDYQLCAMTALHLALKVYDSPTVRVIKLSCLVKLGNGEFTVEDIIQKEQDLVRALGWRINPPTPDCFLQRYVELLPFLDENDDESKVDLGDYGKEEYDEQLAPIDRRRQKRLMKLEQLASEYIEVAMARDRFLSVPPSVIAYAALLSAMELATAEQQKQHQKCFYDWANFLRNMTEVAEMDDILSDFGAESLDGNPNGKTVSRSVLRTKMLLDRIVKGLDLPSEEQDDDYSLARCDSDSRISEKIGDDDDERGDSGRSTIPSTTRSTSPPSPTSTASSVNRAPIAPQL